MFASRLRSQRPYCFCRMESVWPARVTDGPPFLGVTTTVSLVHRYAQSPSTLISWISLVASISNCSIADWLAANRALPSIGGWPGTRNTTSSAIRLRTFSVSPALDALNHVAIRSRIACSSFCMSEGQMLSDSPPGNALRNVRLQHVRAETGKGQFSGDFSLTECLSNRGDSDFRGGLQGISVDAGADRRKS